MCKTKFSNLEKRLRYKVKTFLDITSFFGTKMKIGNQFQRNDFFWSSLYFGELFFSFDKRSDSPISKYGNPKN